MNESSGITPVMPIGGGYGGGFGEGIWLFAILALMGFGGFGGGFGGNLGYRPATAEDVHNGFNFADLQDQNRDIIAAINSTAAQGVAASERIGSALTSDIHDVQLSLADLGARQQECCCNTLRAIDGVNYNAAMNTASINANTTAQTQRIINAITENKMEALQAKVNQLELANQLAGVVRYPSGLSYTAGPSPFCGFGWNGVGNI